MPLAELGPSEIDWPQEDARLSALAATGILDTEPEQSFDAITRLCAEYFRADTVLLGFADASRLWVKSYWGEAVRELPRKQSVFEMVLAANGPVVVPDISKHPNLEGGRRALRRLEVASFASAPVRAFDGWILGNLTIFGCQPRRAMELSARLRGHGERLLVGFGQPDRRGSLGTHPTQQVVVGAAEIADH